MMKTIMLIVALAVFTGNAAAQQEIQLESLLEKAEKSAQKYTQVFRNLIAEELKTIEVYEKDESLDERRVVKSNFIVYQLQKGDQVSELRTVLEFNGRKISQSDNDVVKFFEKLAKSDDVSEEFRKVKKESVRYDGNFVVWGMTLGKDFLLQKEVRKIFDYKIIGREKFGGREVYVVEYRQKMYSPFILANPTEDESRRANAQNGGNRFTFDTVISDKLRPTNPRLNGTMRLDAESGELWKNEYEISIHPATLDAPIVTNKSYYEYQPSNFGVAVPKIIKITSYRTFGKPGKSLLVAKFAATTLEYSKFSELNSEAKDYKVESGKN